MLFKNKKNKKKRGKTVPFYARFSNFYSSINSFYSLIVPYLSLSLASNLLPLDSTSLYSLPSQVSSTANASPLHSKPSVTPSPLSPLYL